MTHVFLMRHADRDYGNDFDESINEAGRARARGISWDCDLAIVSPLRRTAQTLDASLVKARYRLQSPLCRECLDGDRNNYLAGEPLRIETAEDFGLRVEAFRDLLLSLTKSFASILVVTHGAFMAQFLRTETIVDFCEVRRWEPRP